jgi:predicted DNA-binding protein YlxM (UPF0122 family)
MSMISTIKPKKPKDKACRKCKEVFSPKMPLQVVCSLKCSIELAKEKAEKKEAKEWKERKKVLKDKTKKKPEYEHDLEVEVNHIVRLIDKGHECISSGRPKYTPNAGHYFSVGSSPSIRFNLLNIFNQSVHDNMYEGGAPREYLEGIRKTFGEEIANEITELKAKYPEIKLSIPEIRETIKVARQCVRDLMKVESDKPYTTEERIELRRQYNNILGIY